jgi:dolichol-phosphate mannosyltransferase
LLSTISSPIGTATCAAWRYCGALTFYAICALGTVANVGIAGFLFSREQVWWLAGIAGVAVGSVWNYAVSSVFTWKQK